jgi:hypothetical protein
MQKALGTLTLLALLTGVTAAPVDIMVGARGYGMGGAYVALANDPSAAYWNPSALTRVENMSLMNSNWIFQEVEALNVNYLSFAVPIDVVGTVAGSWLMEFAKLEEGPEATTRNAAEHLFSLSIGRALVEQVLFFENPSIGFSINRYTFMVQDDDNGAGLGFDVGVWTGLPMGFSAGATARNLGADMMGEKVDPEVRFGLGFSQTVKEMHRITVGVDGHYVMNRDYTDENDLSPARNNLKYFGGLEYALLVGDWEVALRGGGHSKLYNTLETHGWSAGLGATYLGYSVQYAFKGDTDLEAALGFSHRVDLILQLNNLVPK